MKLLACGVNHETADLAIREQLSFGKDYLANSLRELLQDTQTEEAVILSTCHRTEFYCINGDAQNTMNWLYRHKKLPQDSLTSHWYVYQQEHAVRHLMRLASGLDSKILGEPQILGQIKNAYAIAYSFGSVGAHFNRLFQYVFSVSKQIRYATDITAHPVSLAFAVVTCAKQIFAHLSNTQVLLVGAGETISLVAKHLYSQGIRHFWVANRTLQQAEKLGKTIGGQAICLNAIPYFLTKADIIIAATSSDRPQVKKSMLAQALKERKRKPLFIADLGMPRDIESNVNELEDVYLYTLDDLHTLIQKNQQGRKAAAMKAESLIEAKVQHFLEQLKIKAAAPIICSYRQQAEQFRDTEVKKALALLKKGCAQEEVIKQLAYRLTNKLIHLPSVTLSKAAKLNQKELLATILDSCE
ncbi:MAG: glutamyl-tRNA reductase [Candidatus Aquirickettsiella sp.]